MAEPARSHGIRVIDVTPELTQRIRAAARPSPFSESLPRSSEPSHAVGSGDVLEVSVWEAPPAALYSPAAAPDRAGGAHASVFSELMVGSDGSISLPFAGRIPVGGKAPEHIEPLIAERLKGKAHQPQVLVRLVRNATATVTVVGEVATSLRVPLTAKGERLLDALAAAGGTRQAIHKLTVQITRGNTVRAMPLDAVVQDPAQNVPLQAGDVLTFLYQPHSFTALGSAGRNEEVPFEAQGISLAQALARAGGLVDARADARGVFVFRFEDAAVIDGPGSEGTARVPVEETARVPVVYRADLTDPVTFFSAQRFPVRNGDVLYIANAPAVELQKFLSILVASVYSLRSVQGLEP